MLSHCYTCTGTPYFFPSSSSLILAILKSFAKATIDSTPDILSSHSPEGFLLWKEIAGYTNFWGPKQMRGCEKNDFRKVETREMRGEF